MAQPPAANWRRREGDWLDQTLQPSHLGGIGVHSRKRLLMPLRSGAAFPVCSQAVPEYNSEVMWEKLTAIVLAILIVHPVCCCEVLGKDQAATTDTPSCCCCPDQSDGQAGKEAPDCPEPTCPSKVQKALSTTSSIISKIDETGVGSCPFPSKPLLQLLPSRLAMVSLQPSQVLGKTRSAFRTWYCVYRL